MSNPSFLAFVGLDGPKPVRWITDNEPCEPCQITNSNSILVEVLGDLNGESVTFEGGLTLADKMPFLAHTRVSPFLTTIPAVLHLRPVTKAVGITITVRGIK